MEKYHGYCIGGPAAREHRACASSRLVVPVMREVMPLDWGGPVEEEPVQVSNFEYQHVQHFYVTEGDGGTVLNFWVSSKEKHPRRFVLEELLRSYINGPTPS